MADLTRPTLLAQLTRCHDPARRRGETDAEYETRLARLRAKGSNRPAGVELPLS